MPTRLALGTIFLIRSICLSRASRSDTPVTLVPVGSMLATSWAATGSVTAEYTTGTFGGRHDGLGRRRGDGDDGVGLVADELAGDLSGGAVIALRALILPFQVLARLIAGLLEGVLHAVAHGVQRRVLDDGGHRHRFLLRRHGRGDSHRERHGANRQKMFFPISIDKLLEPSVIVRCWTVRPRLSWFSLRRPRRLPAGPSGRKSHIV